MINNIFVKGFFYGSLTMTNHNLRVIRALRFGFCTPDLLGYPSNPRITLKNPVIRDLLKYRLR